MFQIQLFSVFFISLLLPLFSSGVENNSFAYCPLSTCHDRLNISYPFWSLDSSSPQICGYPGFGINCSDPTSPILYLSHDSFKVKSIDYSIKSISLVDIDVLHDWTCPSQNLTLENLPLEYSKLDKNVTFYFNCTSSIPYSKPVDCSTTSAGKKSYLYAEDSELDISDWYGICEKKVVATVMDSEWTTGGGYGAALDEGFVLDWRSESDCAKCEESDGLCGYSNLTKEPLCFCKDGTISIDHCNSNSKGRRTSPLLKLIIAFSAFGTTIAATCCLMCWIRFTKIRKRKTENHPNVDAFLSQYGSLAPVAYSYSNIRKMTNSFKEKIGEGGYGGVYKGNLNGRPVAVKILKATKGNGEEFINEVASISRTSHVNIVTLLGFCLNRQEKALIYEFMPNGSLDKHIYDKDSKLGWKMLYEIALGIARGMEYLHRGCNSRILHFDIKPHNILLDEDFCPKISDFGLAKLCTRKDSIMSTLEARGTIGYIAPEVFCRNFGEVSHKSDVYSYGMMVLEMVGGRKNYTGERSRDSEIYFPRWAYQRILLIEDINIRGMMTNEEEQIAKKMTLVGLWCIQTDPSKRPTTSKVIEMLEGSLEALQVPPKPFICSPSQSEGSSLPNLKLQTKPFLCSFSSTLESTTSVIA